MNRTDSGSIHRFSGRFCLYSTPRGSRVGCYNILRSVELLFRRLWDLGFDAINWLWRYFLLGAVLVLPIWFLSRLFGAPRGR